MAVAATEYKSANGWRLELYRRLLQGEVSTKTEQGRSPGRAQEPAERPTTGAVVGQVKFTGTPPARREMEPKCETCMAATNGETPFSPDLVVDARMGMRSAAQQTLAEVAMQPGFSMVFVVDGLRRR